MDLSEPEERDRETTWNGVLMSDGSRFMAASRLLDVDLEAQTQARENQAGNGTRS